MSNYALITGASMGIGKEIALQLAQQNINVILVARSEDKLKNICSQLIANYGIKAQYFAIDLLQPNAAQVVYNWCVKNEYPINILVNNAGFGNNSSFESTDIKKTVDSMNLNMNVLVELSYYFIPMLKQYKQQAYILNIASVAAYQAIPYLNVYSATKIFVLHFSRALKFELHKTNISVTAVCPGGTNTDFIATAKIDSPNANKYAKFNMQPNQVAAYAVKAMWAKKAEAIPGFLNKLTKFLAWLMPKLLVEKSAAKIYKK